MKIQMIPMQTDSQQPTIPPGSIQQPCSASRKKVTERYKTIRKRTVNGKVISRLVENRTTGQRKLTVNINAVCNRFAP